MGLSSVRADALADFKLLADVVERKDKLYHCPWAKYEEALVGGLHLLPNENNLDLLSQDYKAMQGMIFGSIPEWNRILNSLYELEVEINGLIK
jgi:hypothetical protein